jgi:serine/threonine-protein kinase HipA
MLANEHVTMQITRPVFVVEIAKNAQIFYKNRDPAYIIKRFDVKADGSKWAQDDFTPIAGRKPQTNGKNFKYEGNYQELFTILKNTHLLTL